MGTHANGTKPSADAVAACYAVEDPLHTDRGTTTATAPQHIKVIITFALDSKTCLIET